MTMQSYCAARGWEREEDGTWKKKHRDGEWVYYGDEDYGPIVFQMEWCGCGRPDLALRALRDVLGLLEDSGGSYEAFRAQEAAVFGGNTGLAYCVYYTLDNAGLTEHGGAVPGWLSREGKDLLGALRDCDLGDHAV